MKRMLIKICGMKDSVNVSEVAGLNPSFIGFILFHSSPRYVTLEEVSELTSSLPETIRKVGVIVNEPLEKAIQMADSKLFDLLQLHGDESPEYCRKLSDYLPLIKAFRIGDRLPDVRAYEAFCEFFILDTHGEGFGGNGTRFDHNLLHNYSSKKEYLLAGGISPGDAMLLRARIFPGMAGVDLNSRFEITPGRKDVNLLKNFINNIWE